MDISAQQRHAVEGVFKAMQGGPAGEETLMGLFADQAVLIEPFSGQPQTHVGKEAIRQNFRDQWANPLPNFKLTVDRVDLDRSAVRAEWTCTSSIFPTPMRGYDLFALNEDGKITRLEIVVTDAPGNEEDRR